MAPSNALAAAIVDITWLARLLGAEALAVSQASGHRRHLKCFATISLGWSVATSV
jgi:hypothetical protein